jgi:carboxyl-terminal processing protease
MRPGLNRKNYNAFQTKNGRTVYDGGGVQPDIEIKQSALTPISTALLREQLIFDYATSYFYNNDTINLNDFSLNNDDFKSFKSFVASSNFDYQTETETVLNILMEKAEEEEMATKLSDEIKSIKLSIMEFKSQSLDDNKDQLVRLLTDEIIKRYFYSEGVYNYYTQNNTEVIKATDLLKNQSEYQNILR